METTDILIAKHILGTISDSELEELTVWRQESKKNEAFFQQIVAYVGHEKKERRSERPLFKDYVQVQLAVHDAMQNQQKTVFEKQRKLGGVGYWTAAACIGLVIFFSMQYFFTGKTQNTTEDLTQEIPWVEKKTPNGQKLAFTLMDGTKVRLNSGSTIAFPSTFGPDVRTVTLQGEAFFEVAKDSLRPFTITSGKVITTVLGTAFNIKAYPEVEQIEVAVVEGKVKVEKMEVETFKQEESILLAPLEMGVYQKNNPFLKKGFDPETVLGWTERKLIFQNATFPEIVSDLERWYGFSFELDKKIAMKQGYNAEFQNQSLKSILESMKFSIGFEYSIDYQQSKVTIK